MKYLVGTDEAGYGPNLGPLVISATVWEAPDGVEVDQLYHRLSHVIAPSLDRGKGCDGMRVAMADSKVLYSGKGLRHLERGLWAALGLLGCCPKTWRQMWHALAPEALEEMRAIPWHVDFDGPLPAECDATEIDSVAERLRAGMAAAGIRLVAVRSRAIFPHCFNDLLQQHGSKGEALSHQTLALMARMIESLPPAAVSVVCDKHGGRNRYGALLAHYFPEWLIEVRGEGRRQSVYRFGPEERRVEVCFRAEGEDCLPAALASMASKYLRELSMRAMNDFWRRHVPDLQPTAGYPQDAKRFRQDIAEAQRGMNISDRVLWRAK